MLFCEYCGEEIRIVKDFVPDTEDLTAVIDDKQTEIQKRGLTGGAKKVLAWIAVLSVLLLLAGAGYLVSIHSAGFQYDKAVRLADRKEYARALIYAEKAVELEPECLEYLEFLLDCLTAEDRQQEARSLCWKILGLDTENTKAYVCLIGMYEKNGEYGKINALLQESGNKELCDRYPAYLAKAPEFSSKGGAFHETISLKLSGNTTGVIYYTMDGTVPDENSYVYTSPIFLESGYYRIRAVFVNDYGVTSPVAEEDYYVDVTVPDAPSVEPEEGNYSRPTLITVEAPESCTVYYTLDGSDPTRDSSLYTGPIAMPVGVSTMRFVSCSAAGVIGGETKVTYSLSLHAALSIESARNRLLIELMHYGVIQDISGSISTGSGHNVYNYRCAVTIEDTDFYLYREYYEDDAGNRAATGTEYLVNIMEGTCYKAVKTQQESSDPWSCITLQDIDSASGSGTEETETE